MALGTITEAETVLAKLAGVPLCPLCGERMESIQVRGPWWGRRVWRCLGRKADPKTIPDWARSLRGRSGHETIRWRGTWEIRSWNQREWKTRLWRSDIGPPLDEVWPSPNKMP